MNQEKSENALNFSCKLRINFNDKSHCSFTGQFTRSNERWKMISFESNFVYL